MSSASKQELSAHSLLSFAEVVELVAPRVRESRDSLRQAKDKVGQRLRYAIRQRVVKASQPGGRSYELGTIVAWARHKWPGKVNDLPMVAITATAHIRLEDATASARGYTVHRDIELCVKALNEALDRNAKLEAELTAAKQEIEKLRPLANRYLKNRQKNRESARRPRRGA
jgi:hypothetical protein